MALRGWVIAIMASGLLVGCTRHSNSAVAVPASTAQTASGLAEGGGVGSSVLASIDNARRAIAYRDPIAADNDISHGPDLAQNDSGQAQPVSFAGDAGPSDPRSDAAALTALLGSFPVRVKLLSAQALLTSGNVAGADSILMSLQSLVSPRLIPRNLPLEEAVASLDRAAEAARLGLPELRTQLLCARDALRSYRGPAHATGAMALAATLDGAVANPGLLRTLLPYQVSIWQASVAQWTASLGVSSIRPGQSAESGCRLARPPSRACPPRMEAGS